MVNVFGDSVASGPGNLQMAKKVVVTKGTFKDHIDEIQQSFELGSIPYRLHTNPYATYITPIRVYDERVHVLDNVATMDVTDLHLIEDVSKLVYFVNGDGVVVLLYREIEDPLEVEVQLENVALKDMKVLLGRLVNWDLLEVKAIMERVVKMVAREILVVLVSKDL